MAWSICPPNPSSFPRIGWARPHLFLGENKPMKFQTPTPNHVLHDNYARRQGRAGVRKLEEGYVSMRIPERDDPKTGVIGYRTLVRLFPELRAEDPTIRLQAWKRLEASELGEMYRVTQRSPSQVRRAAKRGNQGIIVK